MAARAAEKASQRLGTAVGEVVWEVIDGLLTLAERSVQFSISEQNASCKW